MCDLNSAFEAGSAHTIERVRAAIDSLESGDAESLYAMLSGLE